MGSKAENWAPVETMTRAQEFLCEVIKDNKVKRENEDRMPK